MAAPTSSASTIKTPLTTRSRPHMAQNPRIAPGQKTSGVEGTPDILSAFAANVRFGMHFHRQFDRPDKAIHDPTRTSLSLRDAAYLADHARKLADSTRQPSLASISKSRSIQDRSSPSLSAVVQNNLKNVQHSIFVQRLKCCVHLLSPPPLVVIRLKSPCCDAHRESSHSLISFSSDWRRTEMPTA